MQIKDVQSIRLAAQTDATNQTKKSNFNKANTGFAVDKIEISSEGMKMFEKGKLLEIVAQAPDVRMDRIAEVQKKLENEAEYLSSVSNADLAKAIIDSPYSPFSEPI
jgi:anti-sigma28 factor (negative regulator of flagellin synthesis)